MKTKNRYKRKKYRKWISMTGSYGNDGEVYDTYTKISSNRKKTI
jgi:hypothetical protein